MSAPAYLPLEWYKIASYIDSPSQRKGLMLAQATVRIMPRVSLLGRTTVWGTDVTYCCLGSVTPAGEIIWIF